MVQRAESRLQEAIDNVEKAQKAKAAPAATTEPEPAGAAELSERIRRLADEERELLGMVIRQESYIPGQPIWAFSSAARRK